MRNVGLRARIMIAVNLFFPLSKKYATSISLEIKIIIFQLKLCNGVSLPIRSIVSTSQKARASFVFSGRKPEPPVRPFSDLRRRKLRSMTLNKWIVMLQKLCIKIGFSTRRILFMKYSEKKARYWFTVRAS